MKVEELIDELIDLGIKIVPQENDISITDPKKNLTPAIVTKIKENKQEILLFLKSIYSRKETLIPLAALASSYELSSSQMRMWILNQLEPESPVYNMSGLYLFEGNLNFDVLSRSFNELISRHEILRTFFKEDNNGEVKQYISSYTENRFNLEYTDLTLKAASIQNPEALIRPYTNKAFDLSNGPLLRANLIRTDEKKFIFCYVMHHIISDGWSMGVLIKELLILYNTYLKNEASPLPELRIQYKDYAAWQTGELKSGGLDQSKTYWQKKFQGDLPVLELITDQIRPAIKTYNGSIVQTKLNSKLTKRLKELGLKQEATLYMSLLGAVNILLYKYSGQTDIIIGSPIAGRDGIDLEEQIGFYVNTLALRTQFSDEVNYKELLHIVKANILSAYDHQNYPFDELIGDLGLNRDLSRNPLFDVMLVLENVSQVSAQTLGDVKISSYNNVENVTSKFDLTFNFTESDDLLLNLEYNSDLFERKTIERLAGHLMELLQAIVLQPDVPIKDLEFISDDERHKVLEVFNDTFKEYPHQKTIVQLFEEQVNKTPGLTALVFKDKRLTYKELNEEANLLSDYLDQNYQIKPDDLISVMLDRSENFIIAILAVLKSGGAYVPIDPEYPEERIKYILSDSNCKITINEAELVKFNKNKNKYSKENKSSKTNPLNLAYVIYTSGSTGKPKGSMISHKNITRLVCSDNIIDLNSYNKCLSTGSISFDASTFEIWGMLLNGGLLAITEQHELLDQNKIEKIIDNLNINIMWFTSSWFNNLIESGSSIFLKLELIIVGGEQLSIDHIKLARKKNPQLRIVNGYGPTECTTFSAFYEFSKELAEIKNVPIGKPIANTYMYVLNNEHNLQPIGVIGDIYIGGDGLARGYLNNVELTTKSFITDPFKKNELIYRTGDLGRWLADGNLEYTGRKDDQVKIRGYRIELGEIEVALRANKKIDEAVVVAKNLLEQTKDLVAYVVSKEELNINYVREELRKVLPAYMIPSYYVQLDKMPLTANGKLNKKILPDPKVVGLKSGTKYIAPKNEIEEKLSDLWSEILSFPKEKIGSDDNFFELGGHSLKALNLLNHIHKNLGVKLQLKDVFLIPVLNEQAKLINRSKKISYKNIQAAAKQENYSLSSAQKRLFFLHEFAPESLGYNMPIINYLGKSVYKDKIEKTLKQLIKRHESFRTSFEKTDDAVHQRIHNEVEFYIEEYKCSSEDLSTTVNKFIRPFDLAKPPLLRSAFVEVKDKGYVWLIDMHHIISDGTSQQILIEDFAKLYKGQDLPEILIQYKDFSEWQNEIIKKGEQEEQKNYWISKFSDNIPKLNFPYDRPRPLNFTFKGEVYNFKIEEQLNREIKEFLRIKGGTLQMFLVAALNVLLNKYTSQDDIVIGCGIAGRRHSDLDEVVGMFVNTLALRNYPNGKKPFDLFYKEVIDTNLSAYENQDIQFEDLVEVLKVNRDASRNPIFDICLLVQNFKQATESALKILDVEDDSDISKELINSLTVAKTSKFDMNWMVFEKENEIEINLEYYTSIFDRSTIENFVKYFINILKTVIKSPQLLISEIALLTNREETDLFLKQTQTLNLDYPSITIHELFEQQCLLTPNNIAIIHEEIKLTYEQVNSKANKIANFLINEIDLKKEEGVGLLLNRKPDSIISMLAVLKAGGMYIPIETDIPEERFRFIINDAKINTVITEKAFIQKVNQVQWASPFLKNYLCIDSSDLYLEKEVEENLMMNKDLWNHVGERATDQITGGGWLSSYTGEAIPENEMEEYAMNGFKKLSPILNADTRVLEIGCSSGLTLKKVAPKVQLFYGTDMSDVILNNTKRMVESLGHKNVKLKNVVADRILDIEERDFDIVIMNSVIQHFHGLNYLRKVIIDSIELIKDKGSIFIGDVMDVEQKDDLLKDLEKFKIEHAGSNFVTKSDFSSELFVSKSFFNDLMLDGLGIVNVVSDKKIYTIENELTKFRYDVVLHIDKKNIKKSGALKVKKQFSNNVIEIQASENPCLEIPFTNLAYVIYTSGTTGKPKGVLIQHNNVVRLFKNEKPLFNFSENDCWTMFHSYSFDFSVWEMYGALLHGGKLVLVNKDVCVDPRAFLKLMASEKVTVLNQTPSAFYNLIAQDIDLSETKLHLKYVIFGGEALMPGKLGKWIERYPNCKLINMYGITETTVHVTYKEISKNEIEKNISNIGKAIPTLNCYVFDEAKKILPAGIPGELYIGGAGVARGYLNRNDLTNERFIFSSYNKEQKLYKSGDKVILLQNGDMQYLGRIDDQVKIRGYRIEKGEIESALYKQDNIKEAVVEIINEENGEKNLVAYLIANEELNIVDLKNSLRKTLPEYMLPSFFIQLQEFPLTKNGKLDKKALPNPRALEMKTGTNYIPPSNTIEIELVQIWSEILQIEKEKIGIEDNFFDLGGNSILIVKLAKRTGILLSKEIRVSILFQYPNIRSFIDNIYVDAVPQQEEILDRDELIDELNKFNID